MFFEDEKENIEDYNSLDEFDINLDEDVDDETISWDELLRDDSLPSSESYTKKSTLHGDVAKNVNTSVVNKRRDEPQESLSDEIEELYESEGDELSGVEITDEAKKDAFEVFSGETKEDAIEADDLLDDEGQSILDELDDVEVSDNLSDEQEKGNNFEVASDTVVADSQKQKRGINLPAIAGIVFAVVLVLGSIAFVFLGPKSSTPNQDIIANNATEQGQVVQEEPRDSGVNLPGNESENIPVVNDKNAKKLQPEKKVVLNVESAGRVNPFLPTFDGFNGNYYAGIPTQSLLPPDTFGDDQDAQELMRVSVSGILFDSVKPSAIITINDIDYFVQKGDTVDDYNVIDINRQSVVVKKGTNIYKAGVGERFNQNVEITGSAVYGSGGTRHYTSVSDVEVVAK